MLLFVGESHPSILVPILIAVARFGTMANFTVIHITHPMFFPTLFAVTSLGICNLAARFLVIFAPLTAEVDYPFPLVLITVL